MFAILLFFTKWNWFTYNTNENQPFSKIRLTEVRLALFKLLIWRFHFTYFFSQTCKLGNDNMVIETYTLQINVFKLERSFDFCLWLLYIMYIIAEKGTYQYATCFSKLKQKSQKIKWLPENSFGSDSRSKGVSGRRLRVNFLLFSLFSKQNTVTYWKSKQY